MRIVSRKELMALPAGTVYSPFHGNVGERLYAFGGVLGSDFTMCSLLDDFNEERSEDRCEVLERMARGEEVPLVFGEDTCWQREGMFDDTRQYAVWSKQDMIGLAKFLERAAGEPWPDAVENLCEEMVRLTEDAANAWTRVTVLEQESRAAVNGANLTLRTIVLALGGKPSEETNLVWVLKRIEELRK